MGKKSQLTKYDRGVARCLGQCPRSCDCPGQSRGQLTLYRVICGIESRTCKSSPGVSSLPRTAFLANARDDHPLCISSTKIRVLPSSYFVQDSLALSTNYLRSLSSSSDCSSNIGRALTTRLSPHYQGPWRASSIDCMPNPLPFLSYPA